MLDYFGVVHLGGLGVSVFNSPSVLNCDLRLITGDKEKRE